MYQEPARYHSLGNGHVRAISVFGPELDTVQKQLRDAQQQQQFFATQNVQHSTTLPLPALQPSGQQQEKPSTSPVLQLPGTRTTALPEKIKPSDALGKEFSWSAQDQPFGDGGGYTDPARGPGQANKPGAEKWTIQQSHGHILHQERAAANLAEGCGRLAEFFAQFPWEEKIIGLGFAQLNVE